MRLHNNIFFFFEMGDDTLVTSFVVVWHKVKFSARHMTWSNWFHWAGYYQAGQTDSLFRSNRARKESNEEVFQLQVSDLGLLPWEHPGVVSGRRELPPSAASWTPLPAVQNKQTKTWTRSSCKVIGNVVNRGIPFFIFPTAPQSCPLNDPNTDSNGCWQFFFCFFFNIFSYQLMFSSKLWYLPPSLVSCFFLIHSSSTFKLHRFSPPPHLLSRTQASALVLARHTHVGVMCSHKACCVFYEEKVPGRQPLHIARHYLARLPHSFHLISLTAVFKMAR